MQPIGLSVDSFCNRFSTNTRMINAFMETERKDPKSIEKICQIIDGQSLQVQDILDLQFEFKPSIIGVYDREAYAENCKVRRSMNLLPFVTHPLVDKKTNLVFSVKWGVHMYVVFELVHMFLPVEKRSNIVDEGARYLLEGMGYFCTRATNAGVAIGKKLFENDGLDEFDEIILNGYKIVLIERESDLLKIGRRV